MNALAVAVEEMKPRECPYCDGFLLEAGGVLVCNECGAEAIACPQCGALNEIDTRTDSTICEECEHHFCNKCKDELWAATYYQEPDGSWWVLEDAYCYKCEG